jgi:hypothetical protein
MGFFSWDCRGCEHPMLSEWSINKINYWMQSVVAIESKGAVREGFYDGYGGVVPYNKFHTRMGVPEDRINNSILDDGYQDPECWHRACWEIAGKPTEYTEPSTYSGDQGFFFDPGDHDMEKPKKEGERDGC